LIFSYYWTHVVASLKGEATPMQRLWLFDEEIASGSERPRNDITLAFSPNYQHLITDFEQLEEGFYKR
jgi:hypothetical protein